MTDDEEPNTQEMHAVSRKPFYLAVVDDDGVLLRTILLRVVEEYAMNRFRHSAPALQEEPTQVYSKCPGDI